MTISAGTQPPASTFGKVTVAISDSYFMAEPAAAVIVSANSHLQTATGGAHDVARVAGLAYQSACAGLLQGHADGLPQGSAWLTGGQDSEFVLTAGKRKVIQAITLRYFNGERIRATPEIVYHAARSAFAVADAAGIGSVATYLWAIRDGYGTARPAEMARVRAPAEEVAARLPPAVIVEPIDERTCFANVGSDSPSMLAVWLGLLEADFEVDDCPELTDELRKLADRHTRAVR